MKVQPTTAGVETESPTASPTASPSPEPTSILPEGVPSEALAAVVERIVDGDTIWVRVDQPGGALPAGASHQIRLLQIDTPETKDPSKPVECWGPEATAFAQQQLPVGSTVYLVADREDTDRFGPVNRTTARSVGHGECSGSRNAGNLHLRVLLIARRGRRLPGDVIRRGRWGGSEAICSP